MLQKIVIFVKVTPKKRYQLGMENPSLKGLVINLSIIYKK